jgi:copper chaperone CopZ
VTSKLQAIEGVVSIKACSKNNKIDVEFDAEKISLDVIVNAINNAGFIVEEF